MAPLIALVVVTLLARLAGTRGLAGGSFATWSGSLRAGVAALFLMTGTAHFIGLRDDLQDGPTRLRQSGAVGDAHGRGRARGRGRHLAPGHASARRRRPCPAAAGPVPGERLRRAQSHTVRGSAPHAARPAHARAAGLPGRRRVGGLRWTSPASPTRAPGLNHGGRRPRAIPLRPRARALHRAPAPGRRAGDAAPGHLQTGTLYSFAPAAQPDAPAGIVLTTLPAAGVVELKAVAVEPRCQRQARRLSPAAHRARLLHPRARLPGMDGGSRHPPARHGLDGPVLQRNQTFLHSRWSSDHLTVRSGQRAANPSKGETIWPRATATV